MAPSVNVPQADGEIVVAVDGGEPRRYPVSGHRISVDSADDAALLAHVIPGATVSGLAELPADAPVTGSLLAGMNADTLRAHLEEHPEDAAAVLAAEQARPGGPRTTVVNAAERALAGA